MTIKYLDQLLLDLNYYDRFESNFLYKRFNEVDYGDRLGKLKFNSVIDAGEKYKYNGVVDENIFNNWSKVLNNQESTDEDLLIAVIEIFDWGKVYTKNIKTAIDLHKEKKLKSYLSKCSELLKNKNTIKRDNEIIWTSGWTKVYSFLDKGIVIYDSRVSAFLNHTLTYNTNYNEVQNNTLLTLNKHLFNFGGNNDRLRKVDDKYGLNNSSTIDSKWFNANLIASWIIQLLIERLELPVNIRTIERAFFMLGFDLKQIN